MGWGFITLFFYEWWRRGGTYDEERVIICVHHHHHPPLVQLVEIKAKIADSKGEWGGGEEMMPENSDIPFTDGRKHQKC